MSVLVSNVAIESYDDQSIPQVITLTFTNGAKVTYTKSTDGYDNIVVKTEKPDHSEPEFDVGEEKIDEYTFDALRKNYDERLSSLNDQCWVACDEVEQTFTKKKNKLDEFYARRNHELEKARYVRVGEVFENFHELKKKVHGPRKALSRPSERIKIMTQWLRSAGLKDSRKVAGMLESESEHIITTISASESINAEERWDHLLSHVQKLSADVCRSLSGSLQKDGIRTWYDKEMSRIDNVGMIKGVVNSSLFTLVLTTEYFERPYCLFELCVATVAEKPIITLLEAERRFGGKPLSSYKLPELFEHIMTHEIIRIDRDYWTAFTEKVAKRIMNTLKLGSKGPNTTLLFDSDSQDEVSEDSITIIDTI